jgi:hypothetical protein
VEVASTATSTAINSAVSSALTDAWQSKVKVRPRERSKRKKELELPNDPLLLCERSEREERASARTTFFSCANLLLCLLARARSGCSCSSATEVGDAVDCRGDTPAVKPLAARAHSHEVLGDMLG